MNIIQKSCIAFFILISLITFSYGTATATEDYWQDERTKITFGKVVETTGQFKAAMKGEHPEQGRKAKPIELEANFLGYECDDKSKTSRKKYALSAFTGADFVEVDPSYVSIATTSYKELSKQERPESELVNQWVQVMRYTTYERPDGKEFIEVTGPLHFQMREKKTSIIKSDLRVCVNEKSQLCKFQWVTRHFINYYDVQETKISTWTKPNQDNEDGKELVLEEVKTERVLKRSNAQEHKCGEETL